MRRKHSRFPTFAPSGQADGKIKARQKRQWRILTGTVAGVIIFAATVLAFAASGIFAPWTTAVTVGEHKVSTAVYNCYYSKARTEMESMFSMSGGPDLDGYYDRGSGTTGRDVVVAQADAAIQEDFAMLEQARAAGWTPGPDVEAAVDEEAALVARMAESGGYNDVKRYLAATMGAGCDLESYREYVRTVQTAQAYREAYRAGLTFEPAEIEAAYRAAPDKFSMVSFRSFYWDGVDEAQAQAAAASVTDEASFVKMARQHTSAEDGARESTKDETLQENLLTTRLNEGNRAWLLQAGRAYGDVGVVPYKEAGFFILFYIGRDRDKTAREKAVEESLREQAFEQWLAGLPGQYPLRHFWLGMAGVSQ